MDHGFYIVAVRIEHKGRIVASMILARSRRTMVGAACGQSRSMKGPHLGGICCVEGDVRRFEGILRAADPEVAPGIGGRAVALPEAHGIAHGQIPLIAEWLQQPGIEPSGFAEVSHIYSDMINHMSYSIGSVVTPGLRPAVLCRLCNALRRLTALGVRTEEIALRRLHRSRHGGSVTFAKAQ